MPRIAAIVLAAGESQRMGEPKQLLRFGSRTLLDLALGAVALTEIDETVLVLGAHAAEIRARLWLDEVDVVHNPAWAGGMATSVQAGLGSLCAGAEGEWPDWVVVMPCDFALVRPTTVAHLLLRAVSGAPSVPIVCPGLMGRTGHPIVLGRAAIRDALSLNPGVGLDTVVHIHRPQREVVEVDDPGIHFDIDTPEDYRSALKAWEAMQSGREEIMRQLSR